MKVIEGKRFIKIETSDGVEFLVEEYDGLVKITALDGLVAIGGFNSIVHKHIETGGVYDILEIRAIKRWQA